MNGYSTIYVEDYPDLSEDFLPQDQGSGVSDPSEQEVQQERPSLEDNAIWMQEEEQTPKGPQDVQVFGIDPRESFEGNAQGD